MNSLPEGVMIIDQNTSQFKFVNPKLNQTLDISFYCETQKEIKEFAALQSQINDKFEEFMIKLSTDSVEENSHEFLKDLLHQFHITQKSNSLNEFQSNKRIFDSEEARMKEGIMQLHSVENEEQITLYKFLKKERKTALKYNNANRATKVVISYSSPQHGDELQMIGREFIIKTIKVENSENINEINPLCMHMFIDTTQISQLEEAKAQNHYQRQMLANVSHEFRTPLNAMNMSLELMKFEIEQKNKKLLKIATSSCNILSHLVEDIVDHAKIEAGIFEIQDSIFSFNQLLSEVSDIFCLQAQSKNIKLNFQISPCMDKMIIKSDKQRLKQILLNLISNALKFTDSGSITIKVFKSEDFKFPLIENYEEEKD